MNGEQKNPYARQHINTAFLSLSLASFFAFVPQYALAQSITIDNPTSFANFADFVEAILDVIVQIGVPIAAIFIIYSGFLFVTARGNETKLEEAKKALLWTVVGTAVLLGSWVLAIAVSDIVASF